MWPTQLYTGYSYQLQQLCTVYRFRSSTTLLGGGGWYYIIIIIPVLGKNIPPPRPSLPHVSKFYIVSVIVIWGVAKF